MTGGGDTILEITGLRKHFGELRAVDGVDLAVGRGGITAVIGPNGAGKTTLFNLVTGRLPADAGRVVFDGEDITDASPDRITRRGLARSFQISSVFPALTVRENILVAVLARRGRTNAMLARLDDEADSHARCQEILARLRLDDRVDRRCAELGYGDRRRVEVGMVLALEPSLVLLDEPTAGMARGERSETAALIRDLAAGGGFTVVLTEHDVDLVFELAERIVVMHQGRVIADGTPDEVVDDPDVRGAYLGGGG